MVDHDPQDPKPAPPDVMTVVQLAEYLHVSRRTLDDMIAAGTAPPHRVLGSNTRRWLRAAVDEWLVAGGSKPAQDGGSAA